MQYISITCVVVGIAVLVLGFSLNQREILNYFLIALTLFINGGIFATLWVGSILEKRFKQR